MPYIKEPCDNCGKLIQKHWSGMGDEGSNSSGLCRKCLNEKNDADRLKRWLETGEMNYKVSTTIRGVYRRYLYEQQDNKCAICGIDNIWNDKELNFILDHIDGDASNSSRGNLRLICPNCDSQLPTYKSRNRNSARTHRKDY